MPGYPYPEDAYPESEELARWRAEYNTRTIGPEGRDGFLGPEPAADTTEDPGPPPGAGRQGRRR